MPRPPLPALSEGGTRVPDVELVWTGKSARSTNVAPIPSAARASWDLRGRIVRGDRAESLLIQGDAGLAMTELLSARGHSCGPGTVKLCYIDPPYNRGERFEHYHDRAGRAAWLSTLREHLIRARQLLAPDGSLWLHLDDCEQHRARCVLDEVFGEDAFVATIVWQKRTTRDNRKSFSSMHDYIHVYAPAGPKTWKKVRNGLPDEGAFANPDNDPRGPWRSVPMNVQAGHGTASQFYTVTTPTGVRHEPPAGRCWTYTAQRLAELDAQGRVYWPRSGDGKPRLKRFQSEVTGLAPFTIWSADEAGDTGAAKRALLTEFPGLQPFDTPKPLRLLERIIAIATDPGDLVLDYYLGSGTTAVAAQRLGRRWIGIEENARTVEEFALPRLSSAWDALPGRGFALATL
jgi:adenine-specific DNA-methyltransferase